MRPDVILVGAIATIIAAAGTLAGIAAAASFAILLYYAIANIAALRMPADAKLFPDIVPAGGLLACAVLAFSLPLRTIIIGLGLLALGFVLRFIVRAWGKGTQQTTSDS